MSCVLQNLPMICVTCLMCLMCLEGRQLKSLLPFYDVVECVDSESGSALMNRVIWIVVLNWNLSQNRFPLQWCVRLRCCPPISQWYRLRSAIDFFWRSEELWFGDWLTSMTKFPSSAGKDEGDDSSERGGIHKVPEKPSDPSHCLCHPLRLEG